jgi:lysophospholipase L1-like esterase
MRHPPRAVLGVGIVAVALTASGAVLAARGCGRPPTRDLAASDAARRTAPPVTLRERTRILVLGDSNLEYAQGPVRAALRAAGIDGELRGLPGYGLKDLEIFWLPLVRDLVKVQDPAVVVIALGTNDAREVEDADAFSGRLDLMMQAVGNRRVVWITHFDDRGDASASAKRVNDAIRAAPSRWANLAVLDLAPLINANTWLIDPDLLHFSPSGQQLYAREIAVAVRQAAAAAPGIPVSLLPPTLP